LGQAQIQGKLSKARFKMTSIDVKTAVQNGDAEALKCLLSDQPSRANEVIHRGNKCLTHPLHFNSSGVT
jgi:hypothetical protein